MKRQIPPSGMPVFSNDGAHLGHVVEVKAADGWMKLDAPQAPDYWLPLESVQEVGPRYVLLRLRRSEVLDRKWEGPQPEMPSISTAGTDRDWRRRSGGGTFGIA